MKLQEKDGDWWDFPLYDYHRQYGTAMAVMTLQNACARVRNQRPTGPLEFRINGPANFMASLLLSSCCSFNSHFFALQLEHLVHPDKIPA